MTNRLYILTPPVRKLFIVIGVLYLQVALVFGQNLKGIDVHFEKENVVVKKEATFTNFLVINNSDDAEITVSDIMPQKNYPGLIFYSKTDAIIGSGERKRLIIKFIANVEFLKMKSDSITFDFVIKTPLESKKLSATFLIQKNAETAIAIYPFSHENFINPSKPESSIMIFAENKGYAKRSIVLDFKSLPNGLNITPKQQTLSLEGLEKKMIELKISIKKQNTIFPDYNIQIKATDLKNNYKIEGTNVKVIVLTHSRQIVRGPGLESGNNYADVAYNAYSSGTGYTQFRGNTEFSASNGLHGRLNVTADYYMEKGLYNLYDTWLELEKKNTLLRIGNLYGNDYDYSISGRGAKLDTKIGNNKAIEVLALENNFNLYGTYFPQSKGAKIAGLKYSFGNTETTRGKGSYLFDHDPRLSINSHVVHFLSTYTIHNRHHINMELGLSNEKGLLNKDKNNGGTLGLNYNAQLGHWKIHSMNSYGTKSYAGLNRGTFQFNQRIDRTIEDNKKIFVGYQISQMSPEYLTYQREQGPTVGNIYPEYFHSIQTMEAGYQFSIRSWNFLLSPQIEQQKSKISTDIHELLAYRLLTNIGTSLGSHGAYLTTEYSYSTANQGMDWFNGLRTDMLYRFRNFSVNSSVQWNPTNVIDLNSFYYDERNFVNYNLYGSYNFQALNRTLNGFLSAGINYSGLYQNTYNNATFNLEYKVSPSWSATGYFNYSTYRSIEDNGYVGENYQIRMGLKKYFRTATSTGNHKVRFLLFEDDNYNGLRDKDESVLPNEIVKLNDIIAITDKNGKVYYQNVPTGKYKLKVNESTGARLMIDPVLMVNKKVEMEVGLVKKVKVSGKLSEVREPYDELGTDVTGIMVYAKNENGYIQTAIVNQFNEFEFFLQVGTYDIYIENDKYNFIDSVKTIEVSKTADQNSMIFEYKKKDTNIKIKKF